MEFKHQILQIPTQKMKDYPIRAFGSKDLRQPEKHLYRNELDLDATKVFNEDSEEKEEYQED